MTQDNITEVRFPLHGMDQSKGFGEQSAMTSPLGVNVRVFDSILFRARGGSRPGLARYLPQLPGGSSVVQHLNIVVRADYQALGIIDDPGSAPVVDDPSSVGPPDSWGTGTLYIDPSTGNPVTGTTLGRRNPGDSLGNAPKRRKKGTGFQPNKNILTKAPDPGTAPKKLFGGFLTIKIHCAGADPFHWDGQEPFFFGQECRYYQPPTIPAPASCQTFASIISQRDAFLALPTLAPYLTSYDVIGDTVTAPGADCLHVGGTD